MISANVEISFRVNYIHSVTGLIFVRILESFFDLDFQQERRHVHGKTLIYVRDGSVNDSKRILGQVLEIGVLYHWTSAIFSSRYCDASTDAIVAARCLQVQGHPTQFR